MDDSALDELEGMCRDRSELPFDETVPVLDNGGVAGDGKSDRRNGRGLLAAPPLDLLRSAS